MIFTRKIDDGLTSLVKKLDAVVADNQDKEMAVLVAFLGEDAEAQQEAAAEFGKRHKISNTILVVPEEHANGPKQYGIPAEVSLVVILYQGKKVKVMHELTKGQLDKKRIAAIVDDTAKILTEQKKAKRPKEAARG